MKRSLKPLGLVMVMLCLVGGVSANAENNPVLSVTAISEVFGDGQKVTAVAVAYDTEIDADSLSDSSYTVDGRTVTRVYTNNSSQKSETGAPGSFVIMELETTIDASAYQQGTGGGTRAQGDKTNGGMPGGDAGRQGGSPTIGQYDNDTDSSNDATAPSATVTQTGDIRTADGTTYAASATAMVSDQAVQLIVDDFLQFSYQDAETGIDLAYNLYIPENYDPTKTYPMVMFIHDASGVGNNVTKTLTQGLGAVIWASPEEQAKHECFVLAPAFSVTTVDDNWSTTQDLVAVVNLVRSITEEYSIDQSRIYTTGQSMGCMSSIVLMLREPDLFAAGMLVAGQWDTSIMEPLKDANLWIQVCEGDNKAYPGMNEAVAVWEAAGTQVSQANWDPDATVEQQAQNVAAMEQEDTNIKYAHFTGGSHRYTWAIAYSIEGVRDWLFKQVNAAA